MPAKSNGHGVITQNQLDLLAKLVDQGCYSQRDLCHLTGIGRGTIQAILSGRRGWYPTKDPEGEQARKSPYHTTLENVGRCPECGADVEMPCRKCTMDRLAKEGKVFKQDMPRKNESPPKYIPDQDTIEAWKEKFKRRNLLEKKKEERERAL